MRAMFEAILEMAQESIDDGNDDPNLKRNVEHLADVVKYMKEQEKENERPQGSDRPQGQED